MTANLCVGARHSLIDCLNLACDQIIEKRSKLQERLTPENKLRGSNTKPTSRERS